MNSACVFFQQGLGNQPEECSISASALLGSAQDLGTGLWHFNFLVVYQVARLVFQIALIFIKERLRPISLGLIRSAEITGFRNKITLAWFFFFKLNHTRVNLRHQFSSFSDFPGQVFLHRLNGHHPDWGCWKPSFEWAWEEVITAKYLEQKPLLTPSKWHKGFQTQDLTSNKQTCLSVAVDVKKSRNYIYVYVRVYFYSYLYLHLHPRFFFLIQSYFSGTT